MKRQVFFKTKDIKVTHWVDDWSVYRWDVAITKKALVEMSKEDLSIFQDAFREIGGVINRAAKGKSGKNISEEV